MALSTNYSATWMRVDRKRNPEKYRIRERAHRKKPEVKARIKETHTRWKNRCFFKWKAFGTRRWCKDINAVTLARLYKKQRGLCALTGRKLRDLPYEDIQLDHIIPRSRGGAGTLDNLRFVCRAANDAKRALLDAELVKLCQDILTTLTLK